MTTTREIDFRHLVMLAEGKDYIKERDHPVVYKWPLGNERRDPGADGGPYGDS